MTLKIVLPWFDFCTSDIFFINKQFRTSANAFPNEFTVRSYEYWVGQHWILSWMEENQTATYFVLGYFRMILWNISTAIYLYGFLNQSLGLILGIFFFIKITACMPLWNVTNLQLYFPPKSLIVSSVINGNVENSVLLASSYTEGYK